MGVQALLNVLDDGTPELLQLTCATDKFLLKDPAPCKITVCLSVCGDVAVRPHNNVVNLMN